MVVYQIGRAKDRRAYHLHRWAVWFLVAVGVWNFLGAGVFGFLINLSVVSYYEIGTALTANHGHTAIIGVYGMLAVGLLLFCCVIEPAQTDGAIAPLKISFWLSHDLEQAPFQPLFYIAAHLLDLVNVESMNIKKPPVG